MENLTKEIFNQNQKEIIFLNSEIAKHSEDVKVVKAFEKRIALLEKQNLALLQN